MVTETKELKAQWPAEPKVGIFTREDVAKHNSKGDIWIIIHGKVFDISTYLEDHPGGIDALVECAGTDATTAYEDVGHSEDANEIMQPFLVGVIEDAAGAAAPIRRKPVTVIPRVAVTPLPVQTTSSSSVLRKTAYITLASGAVVAARYLRLYQHLPRLHLRSKITSILRLPQGGFAQGLLLGFLPAATVFTLVGSYAMSRLSAALDVSKDYSKYPPHMKSKAPKPLPRKVALPSNQTVLNPKEYRKLPLTHKEFLSPNVLKLVFALPTPDAVLGLPTGQHVAIRAQVDGQWVSRSYTPISNNADRGRLELLIKIYPDGLLTGRYLANLVVGDEVEFRGPKGAMKYHRTLLSEGEGAGAHIGMVAGGTGITPMYQLIRAICEDPLDTTQVSLVYANQTEADILLRDRLDDWAARFPDKFRVWYMLDRPPADGWRGGAGFVSKAVLEERMPAAGPRSKVMLCGPPGMVNAVKKALGELGWEKPGAVAKITDQVFCF